MKKPSWDKLRSFRTDRYKNQEVENIGTTIEQFGYAAEMPSFRDIVNDEERTTPIEFNISEKALTFQTNSEAEKVSLTEHEAIATLDEFFKRIVNDASVSVLLRQEADAFLDSLNYIGSKELEQAAAGLAQYYKNWLNSSRSHQLVLTLMSENGGDATGHTVKSDIYFLDKIMANFSDEELKEYAGRLHRKPEDSTSTVEKTKIVVLDDWSISGEQMMYVKHMYLPDWALIYPEINLAIAKKQFIEHGFSYHGHNHIPLKSYFLATEDQRFPRGEGQMGHVRTTGFHSSVDYGFEVEIAKMVKESSTINVMPPLTNIIRLYRKANYRPENVYRAFGNETAEQY